MQFGMLFSLKQLVRKLRPVSDPAAPDPAFLAFRTNNYKLHVAETATGLRFLLHTEPSAPNMRDAVARCVAAYALETANDPLVEPVSAEANATEAAEIRRRLEGSGFVERIERAIRGAPAGGGGGGAGALASDAKRAGGRPGVPGERS
jgi:hypothetical protein